MHISSGTFSDVAAQIVPILLNTNNSTFVIDKQQTSKIMLCDSKKLEIVPGRNVQTKVMISYCYINRKHTRIK